MKILTIKIPQALFYIVQARSLPRGVTAPSPKIVVHVENVGEERARGVLLHLDLVHLVVHDDGLARDRLSRTAHVQDPRQPLQEQGPHLRVGAKWQPIVLVCVYSIRIFAGND